MNDAQDSGADTGRADLVRTGDESLLPISRRALTGLVVCGVVAVSTVYLQPLLVGAMIVERGYSEQQAGVIAALDLAGTAVASLAGGIMLAALPWDLIARGALAILVVANICTLYVDDVVVFGAVRFVGGFGCGPLLAIAMVGIGRGQQADRHYGILLAAQLTVGALLVWIATAIMMRAGLNGGYGLLAGLAGLAYVLTGQVPTIEGRRRVQWTEREQRGWFMPVVAIASILTFFVEQNAVWAYIERIGALSGLAMEFVGFCLGIAILMGLVGASLVIWLGARAGYLVPLTLATVVQLLSLAILAAPVTSHSFAWALGALALAWNVVIPYQLGLLAALDRTGRSLSLAAAVTSVGFALGPVAGAVVIRDGDYLAVPVLAAGLAVLTLLLLLPSLLHLRREAQIMQH